MVTADDTCWCSAPGRSVSPSSRWRAPAAPRSTSPNLAPSGSPPPPSSAPRRSPAATGCSTRSSNSPTARACRSSWRRPGAAGDGIDDRPRRRRRAHRHPRAGQEGPRHHLPGPRLHPQGSDDPRLARLASTVFPEALDLLASRRDPLSRDRQLASLSAKRPASSPSSPTIRWPCTRPYSSRRTHEARHILASQRQAQAMPASSTATTSPA